MGEITTPVAIRKLNNAEVAQSFPERGQTDLGAYLAVLNDLEPGDGVEVAEPGPSTRAIKRRVGQTAKQLGYRLKWSTTNSKDGFLYFQVLQGKEKTPAANSRRRSRKVATASESPATTPKRRGR